ncbi:MAG: SGNH/GDSL hydrolase family protein [Spirochaetota bacterium]
MKNIQIFGDSIMKGVLLDPVKERYYTIQEHGKTWLEKQFGFQITNTSLFGCTISKGEQLFERARSKGHLETDVVLLEFGGNDCDFNWRDVAENPRAAHLPNTPLELFEAKFRNLLRHLKKMHIRPLMMTIPPIHAERYLQWISHFGPDTEQILTFLGGNVQAISTFQEMYSQAISSIAEKTHTMLVDVRSKFLSEPDLSSLLCKDGIHPNERGHQLMTEAFSDFAAIHLPAERLSRSS